MGGFVIKERDKEKWLGDYLHKDGLDASIQATILSRSGEVKAVIFEIKAIVEDLRMQNIGGLMCAIDIWELSIIPSLMFNSEMWVGISEESIGQLENIQNLFLRNLLDTPFSTTKPAMKWDTGILSMKTRIMKNKLVFVNAIKHLDDDCLAKQIYEEQISNNWPGLTKECSDICRALGLPVITENHFSKNVWKRLVTKACLAYENETLSQSID